MFKFGKHLKENERLVETNRLLTDENTRLKQSISIQNQRITTQTEILQKLETERQIIEARLMKARNEHEICSKRLTTLTLQLIEKNELMLEIKVLLETIPLATCEEKSAQTIAQSINKIRISTNTESTWEEFKRRFEDVHREFTNILLEKHPDLTNNQIKLCQLLKLQLSSKKIGHLLNINPRSVDRNRYELRKKFGLCKDESLSKYLNDLG